MTNEWIDIKKQRPPFSKKSFELKTFVLANHSIHGVGVAWFWTYGKNDGIIDELEEDFKDKFLCSYQFIHSEKDQNDCVDIEEDDDIFEKSPHFRNLGTITHWMPLPSSPE